MEFLYFPCIALCAEQRRFEWNFSGGRWNNIYTSTKIDFNWFCSLGSDILLSQNGIDLHTISFLSSLEDSTHLCECKCAVNEKMWKFINIWLCSINQFALPYLLHIGLLMESLAAEPAWIRSCVTVYEEMRRQRARPLESLAALFALEHFLNIVYSSVIMRWEI